MEGDSRLNSNEKVTRDESTHAAIMHHISVVHEERAIGGKPCPIGPNSTGSPEESRLLDIPNG